MIAEKIALTGCIFTVLIWAGIELSPYPKTIWIGLLVLAAFFVSIAAAVGGTLWAIWQ